MAYRVLLKGFLRKFTRDRSSMFAISQTSWSRKTTRRLWDFSATWASSDRPTSNVWSKVQNVLWSFLKICLCKTWFWLSYKSTHNFWEHSLPLERFGTGNALWWRGLRNWVIRNHQNCRWIAWNRQKRFCRKTLAIFISSRMRENQSIQMKLHGSSMSQIPLSRHLICGKQSTSVKLMSEKQWRRQSAREGRRGAWKCRIWIKNQANVSNFQGNCRLWLKNQAILFKLFQFCFWDLKVPWDQITKTC